MQPDPSPRPAALVIAETIDRFVVAHPNGDVIAVAILLNLAEQGLVLIPRAELEEAADHMNDLARHYRKIHKLSGDQPLLSDDLANRLRQRSRG